MTLRWTQKDRRDAIRALRDCVAEMKVVCEPCDHSVGICWCSYHRAMESAQHLLDQHDAVEIFKGFKVTDSGSVECPHCHWGFAPQVIEQHIREKH